MSQDTTGTIAGTIVESDGVKSGIITYEDGVITSFERTLAPVDNNRLIFPGFIDIHTHCRHDASGHEMHKEDYVTAGRAALNGGVTFVADMPNNPIAPTTCELWQKKQKLADALCKVDVLCYAGVGPETHPFGRSVPYKVFMGPSIGSLFFKDKKSLVEALKRYRDLSVSFHCEDPLILQASVSNSTHETRRPEEAEYKAIEDIIDLIAENNINGKICHVSTKRGIETIICAKKSGIKISAEVTPHHLYFDHTALCNNNRRTLQMNPPIRGRIDRLALLEHVRNNDLDYLATDHAPHTMKEKLNGISGVPQLDTYGPFVAWLMKEAKVDPVTILKMACHNPGDWIWCFTGRKIGRIKAGYEASFTILDLSMTAIDGRQIYSKCGWSPFDLRLLPGFVDVVYLRGKKVVDGLYMI